MNFYIQLLWLKTICKFLLDLFPTSGHRNNIYLVLHDGYYAIHQTLDNLTVGHFEKYLYHLLLLLQEPLHQLDGKMLEQAQMQ